MFGVRALIEPTDWAARLLRWFDASGRKTLPWQSPRTPYRVWISEIMLQQTQVSTVIAYFERFMARFPDVAILAAAPVDEVLHLWTGLGYYARARNLHRAAQLIVSQHAGELPIDHAQLMALPGIGRSTASAILAQACGLRHAILDGNVKRVLSRVYALKEYPGSTGAEAMLWQWAEALTPHDRLADYTQAMMDLGALVCTRAKPQCDVCPMVALCQARHQQLQHELPVRKPRVARRQRHELALVAFDDLGRLLLERRPPAGIWGGLWVCPQFADDQSLQTWVTQHLVVLGAGPSLPVLQHAFTHFDLSLQLHAMQAAPAAAIAELDRYCWYDARRPERIGLAKPVLDILQLLSRVQS